MERVRTSETSERLLLPPGVCQYDGRSIEVSVEEMRRRDDHGWVDITLSDVARNLCRVALRLCRLHLLLHLLRKRSHPRLDCITLLLAQPLLVLRLA